MGQHALDGEMGLAGIGGAEDGCYATRGGHNLQASLEGRCNPGQGFRQGEIATPIKARIQRGTNPVRIADQWPIQALFRMRSICFLGAGFDSLKGPGQREKRSDEEKS